MRTRHNTNPIRKRAAFTLTELLVVLLLIGILTGVMVAEMRGTFQDALLRSAAREVMNVLGLASSRAVTLNEVHTVTFLRASNAFSIAPARSLPAENGEEPRSRTEVRQLDERIAVEIRDPAEMLEEAEAEEQKNDRDVITFHPDGTADRREIVLRDDYNVELVLRINPVSGRVRLVDE